MNGVLRVLTVVMAVGMTGAGLVHFLRPRSYLPIVPEMLPSPMTIIYVSGVLECLGGIGLFIPALRREAAWIVLGLMLIFLPVHIWDLTRLRPAMGSTAKAAVRLVVQFALIAWAWLIVPGK